MTETRAPSKPRRAPSRGRIDKRRAILDAAFRVFAREGYGQSCVQEIAAEAGVAKPTIYNHMHDKESLFREAMETVAMRVADRSLASLDPLREPSNDIGTALTQAARHLVRCHCEDESWALRRLLYAEAARFPDLLGAIQQQGVQRLAEALADRLARLTLAGRLHARHPEVAAEQFLALLTAPLETRSRLGTRPLAAKELDAVADAAVHTFLRAYSSAGLGPDPLPAAEGARG